VRRVTGASLWRRWNETANRGERTRNLIEKVGNMGENEESGPNAVDAAPAPNQQPHWIGVRPLATSDSSRRSLSVRTRFEVFKRDEFTCRYCGRKSPEIVLEVDHVVPVCEGGDDDQMNLVTACWECNSGKSGVPLERVIAGDDPYDKAIEALERERQLREYNALMAVQRERREGEFCELRDWWCTETGRDRIGLQDVNWLRGALLTTAAEEIRYAMEVALSRGYDRDFRYVAGILRNRRQQGGE
jgi:hypothetical protein